MKYVCCLMGCIEFCYIIDLIYMYQLSSHLILSNVYMKFFHNIFMEIIKYCYTHRLTCNLKVRPKTILVVLVTQPYLKTLEYFGHFLSFQDKKACVHGKTKQFSYKKENRYITIITNFLHSSAKVQSPPLSVLLFCLCNKVYHKHEAHF